MFWRKYNYIFLCMSVFLIVFISGSVWEAFGDNFVKLSFLFKASSGVSLYLWVSPALQVI